MIPYNTLGEAYDRVGQRLPPATFRGDRPRQLLQAKGGVKTFAPLVAGFAIVGWQMAMPIDLFAGRENPGTGASIALFLALPVCGFAPLGFAVMMASRAGRICLLTFGGFVSWILLGAAVAPPAQGIRHLLTPIAQLAILCGSSAVFYYGYTSISRWLAVIVHLAVGAFLLLVVLMFIAGHTSTLQAGTEHSVVRYTAGNVLPTELAIVLGVQFCYCLYLLRSRQKRRLVTVAILCTNLCCLVFVAWSRAAFGGYLVVLALFAMGGSYSRLVRICVALLVAAALSSALWATYLQNTAEQAAAFLSGDSGRDSRLSLYSKLWDLAQSHPLFGIGLNNFVETEAYYIHRIGRYVSQVPHQNLLGRACENGIPCAVFYALFIVVVLYVAKWRRGLARVDGHAECFVQACFLIFVFLQFRGLFCDTWNYKEMYFAVGAAFGVRQRQARLYARGERVA